MEAILPRLGSGGPSNFPDCSGRFLKTEIVENSWKLLVQLYFHYPELHQNWIQKTGSFLILNSIYELKKFLQSPLTKEKVGFLFRFFSDCGKWIKLQNSDLHFGLHCRTRILIHCKTTDHLPRLFLAQFQTRGHILIWCCSLGLSDHRTAARESSCYVLYNQKKQIHLKQWIKFCTSCWPDGIVNCYNSSAKQRKEVF